MVLAFLFAEVKFADDRPVSLAYGHGDKAFRESFRQ